ncbi:MAG: DNA primase, partial [Pirellulaceae bacterium]|nr:DNA primase [Pirellulaceae bacterium]
MALGVDQKLEIEQATDIVDLIGEHISLRRKGREHVGLCPFHDDHTPSLTVVPHKRIFHCFVCGTGGNVFSFVMKYHRMTFPEALKYLADRAGIRLKQGSRGVSQHRDADQDDDRKRLLEANARALACFCALLRHPQHGRIAREYVLKRGFSAATLENFQIGYAPDRWDGLVSMVAQKGWDARPFEHAGLISNRSGGEGHYDRFRHRLIFPIFDSIGRPIAFGARRLHDSDEPKYLNSPETALFHKSATLYGLDRAKRAITAGRLAVVVEGYTDVIACHQAGLHNVVATLGTALTSQHVNALRYYAQKVVLIFDADEAGRQAADRAVEAFLTGRVDVLIAVLPDTQDPAQVLAQPDGVARWHHAIEHATDALTYQFERVRDRIGSEDTISGRQQVAEEYLRRLATLGLARQGPIRRALIIQQVADLLRLSEQQVISILRRLGPSRTVQGDDRASGASDNQRQSGYQSRDGVALSDSVPT